MLTKLQTPTITPAWLSFQQAEAYSGIKVRCWQNYAKAGHVLSSHVRAPGASRGRTILNRASIDAFIEAGVGGKAALVMNTKREGAA